MGIIETSIREAKDKREELIYWAEVLGFELNEMLDEMPQLREIIKQPQ
jgi:hypothetical protein